MRKDDNRMKRAEFIALGGDEELKTQIKTMKQHNSL